MQKPQPRSLNQTAFSPKTAKFVFIALLTFAITLTSFSTIAQSVPQKAIAYTSSSTLNPNQIGIFSIQPTGRDRRELVSAIAGGFGAPLWSANGQRIAFTVGEQDVYIVNADGSNLKKRFAGEACKAPSLKLQWLSDNQRLAFSRSCDGFTSDTPGSVSWYLIDGNKPAKQIWSLDTNQGIRSNLAFSSDGRQVSFVKNRSLYKINIDGSGTTQLTPADSETMYDFSSVVWSPDRRKIARIDYASGKAQTQRISIVQTDGKLLAQWKSPGINWSIANLIWSPNSQQVAYYHLESDNLQSIYQFDLTTKTSKALTRKPGEYNDLTWSPDGRQLAFTLKIDPSRTALYTLNLDRSTLKDLTQSLKAESIDDPNWSPDSRQLTFIAGALDKNNLYVINRDGSGLKQLTRDLNTFISAPTWQP
ncbi:MAG: DPP IV N-terminal domain-containing protein [Phormidium tanganyikae FI6-MK23]|nr:DPP IV N-terminal domain-containing protein [Phormidium tanganyikae FI6-MK23]